MEIGLNLEIPKNKGFEKVEEIVRDSLKSQGFGILTEIDVKETMKKKLDLDYKPYKILGACNPPKANQAIQALPDIGLLLPCNVIIFETKNNTIRISIVKPISLFGLIEDKRVKPIANEVEEMLLNALEDVKERLK